MNQNNSMQNNTSYNTTAFSSSYSTPNIISVRFEEFEGPLDLLLSLVRQHKMDIYDISIAIITKQYIEKLNELITYSLDDLTAFYQIAAWLLHIKSQMLLPISTDIENEEINNPQMELIHTLIEYQKYKKLSSLLSKKQESFTWASLRVPNKTIPIEFNKEALWKEVNADQLFAMFIKIAKKNSISEHVINLNEPVSINEKIILILEMIEKNKKCTFIEVLGKGGQLALVCTFLAILELVKQQEIQVIQHIIYEDIIINKKQ